MQSDYDQQVGAVFEHQGSTANAEAVHSVASEEMQVQDEASVRAEMVAKVVDILNNGRRNLSDYRIEEHYNEAKFIEEQLFSSASSREHYLDEDSLPARVQEILQNHRRGSQAVKPSEEDAGENEITQRMREAQQKMREAPPVSRPRKRRFEPVEFEMDNLERNRVLEALIGILQTRRPNATVDWHSAIPHLHRRLEKALYRQATSLAEYADLNTLPQRLQQFVNLGGSKKPFQLKVLKSAPIPEHLLHPTKPSTPAAASSAKASSKASGARTAPAPKISTAEPARGEKQARPKTPPAELLRQQQQRLLLLQHAAQCTADEGECQATPLCWSMRQLWKHINTCTVSRCPTPHCVSSRYVLSHYCNCVDPACRMCQLVREGRGLDSLNSSAEETSAAENDAGATYKRKLEPAQASDENTANRAQPRRRIGFSATPGSTGGGSHRSSGSASAGSGGGGGHLSAAEARQMAKHISTLFTPVIDQLLAVPQAQAYFGAPVDPIASGAPNYLEVIKRPMDLGTILQRLHSFFYTHVQDLLDDVHLVFENACSYNPPGTIVNNLAKRLRTVFGWASRKPRIQLSELSSSRQSQHQHGAPSSSSSSAVGRSSSSTGKIKVHHDVST